MTVPDWAPASGDETVVWQGQPRLKVVLRGAAAGAVLALFVLGIGHLLFGDAGSLVPLAATLAVALLGFAVPTLAAYLWRQYTHYVLTDAALYHRTGVVRITVTELGLDKVQNTSYSQGVFGTLFDHGTVDVDTAGSEGSELRLRHLDDPDEVHRVIAAEATEAGGRDEVPGTVEQWQAVLGEIRQVRSLLLAD